MSNILLKNLDIITGERNEWFIGNSNIGISGNIIKFIEPADDPGAGATQLGNDCNGAGGGNGGNGCNGSNTCNGGKDGYVEKHSDFLPDIVVDLKGKTAIPGLINAHTHTGMTLFRNHGNDLPLHDWLFKKIFPAEEAMTGEEVYWGTMTGIAEMIMSGTTACADMYLYMDNSIKAYAESGFRVNVAPGPFKFISTPKPHLEDHSEWFRSFFREWDNSCTGRIKVYLQAHSVYILDREHLLKTVELANELNTGIHIHILETLREKEDSIKLHGMGVMDACKTYGILDRPVIAAHCVHLDDHDRELMAEHGINAVHNPVSNLKLGSGIADIPSMIMKGINTALGTDGPASNNVLDMIREMKFAALLQKGVYMDPTVLDSYQIMEMATVNGAAAIGEKGLLGKIKPGYKADITILNTCNPHLRPVNDPTADIVYCANGSDADTVLIDGNIVMRNRELTTIDLEKSLYMTEKAAQRILK